MQPIEVNVKVSIDLTDRTDALIREVLSTRVPQAPCHCCDAAPAEDDLPESIADPTPDPAPETPKEAPAPSMPAPVIPEITDAVLREEVKAAKDRRGAKAVREAFGRYGISVSSDCPTDRRGDLVSDLRAL